MFRGCLCSVVHFIGLMHMCGKCIFFHLFNILITISMLNAALLLASIHLFFVSLLNFSHFHSMHGKIT